MPYFAMSAEDVEAAINFFQGPVDDGRLKVINAAERPDVWSRVEACEDPRLIIMPKDMTVPEGVDIAKVLPEFSTEVDAETQLASWLSKPESETPGAQEVEAPTPDQTVPSADPPTEAAEPQTAAMEPLSTEPTPVEDKPTGAGKASMDREWSLFTSRGFKG